MLSPWKIAGIAIGSFFGFFFASVLVAFIVDVCTSPSWHWKGDEASVRRRLREGNEKFVRRKDDLRSMRWNGWELSDLERQGAGTGASGTIANVQNSIPNSKVCPNTTAQQESAPNLPPPAYTPADGQPIRFQPPPQSLLEGGQTGYWVATFHPN